tara:strand:- start:1405 stop:1803 length:399 start_codon:yes stop_codon:yes gene_type:complete
MNEPGSPLMNGLGLQEIVSTDPAGRAVLRFEVRPQHCHAVAQGGYVTAWIDAAMARSVAAATEGQFGCSTLEIKVAFYEPVQPDQIVTAEGWVVRKGRSTVFLEGELRNDSGDVMAKGTSTAKLASSSIPGP